MLIKDHFIDYRKQLNQALDSIDTENLSKVFSEILQSISRRDNIFVCGNGGSAAIAEHFVADNSKLVSQNTAFKPKMYSLVSNAALLTAYANDNGYEYCFSEQLKLFGHKTDLLIAISSSGKSPNIINAIRQANKMGMTTISITGFDGGEAKQISLYNIHVNSHHYGKVEDCHHIIMHNLASFISLSFPLDFNNVRL